MKSKNPKSWITMLGVGALASLSLSQARAELVYEEKLPSGPQSAQIEERGAMRQAIQASENAQTTLQAGKAPAPEAVEAPAPIATAPMPAAAVTTTPASAVEPETAIVMPSKVVETQNFSKAELMRRERQREELKNEDLLQTRLEELRLRDERRRTDEVLSATKPAAPATPAPVVPVVADVPVKEEVVSTPVVGSKKPVATADAAASSSLALVTAPEDAPTAPVFSIAPRFGFANMVNNTGMSVRPRYSAGISAGVNASDHLSFDLGYTYNEFGITGTMNGPLSAGMATMAAASGLNTSTMETFAFKQNVVDMGVKLHFLGPDAKIRPFVGTGGAYSKGYLNYDNRFLNYVSATNLPGVASDYDLQQFLGFLSSGLDVSVSKSISVGATFKYYNVFSSRENAPLNPLAFQGIYGPYGFIPYYGATAGAYATAEKQMATGSIANNSFYSIMGNVTFSF